MTAYCVNTYSTYIPNDLQKDRIPYKIAALGRIPHVFRNTYSKRGPKMDVFRIKFSSLREFTEEAQNTHGARRTAQTSHTNTSETPDSGFSAYGQLY